MKIQVLERWYNSVLPSCRICHHHNLVLYNATINKIQCACKYKYSKWQYNSLLPSCPMRHHHNLLLYNATINKILTKKNQAYASICQQHVGQVSTCQYCFLIKWFGPNCDNRYYGVQNYWCCYHTCYPSTSS